MPNGVIQKIGAWRIEAFTYSVEERYVGAAVALRDGSRVDTTMRFRDGPHPSERKAREAVILQAREAVYRQIAREATGCIRFLF